MTDEIKLLKIEIRYKDKLIKALEKHIIKLNKIFNSVGERS